METDSHAQDKWMGGLPPVSCSMYKSWGPQELVITTQRQHKHEQAVHLLGLKGGS